MSENVRIRVFLAFLIIVFSTSLEADLSRGWSAYDHGDYTTAVREFVSAAEAGNDEAMLVLGMMYDHGDGVRTDHAEAVKWYRRAAERNNKIAQHNLGVMYSLGRGLPKDYMEAKYWYRQSAEQNFSDAKYS